MASFKYKPNRIKYRTEVKTLDELHNKFIGKFDQEKENLKNKNDQIKNLKKELEDLENNIKTFSQDEIKKRANLKEEIETLQNDIQKVESNNNEMEYYIKTSDIIFDYYDITEGKYYNENTFCSENNTQDMKNKESELDDNSEIKNSEEDTYSNKKRTASSRLIELNELSKKHRKVKKVIKKRNTFNEPVNKSHSILSFLSNDKNSNSDKSAKPIVEEVVSNRATLQDEYLKLVDNNYYNKPKSNVINMCSKCNIEKVLIPSEGLYTCTNCGEVEYVIIESEVPSHKDAINEKPKYPYKKINHLIEKLNQFQSKESNNIPDCVFIDIENQIRIKNLNRNDISLHTIKEILRKKRYNKYYENAQFIFSKVTKTPPPLLTRDQEEEVKTRFRLLEEPFMLFKDKNRSNFLNYGTVLHKIFLIMGLESHAKYFPLLKSKDKVRKQDKTWKKMCEYLQKHNKLDWTYHSSI